MSEPTEIEIAGFPGLYAEGEGERRPLPLVFLHGTWGQHEHFSNYLRFFSEAGYACYAVSRRGRLGVPPEHARGVRFQDYLDDTLSTLGAIGREPIVVGYSLGGLLAQKVAESGGCRAAILVAPVAPRDIRMRPPAPALRLVVRHLPDLLLGKPFVPSYEDAVRTLLNQVPEDQRPAAYNALVPDSGILIREPAWPGVPVDASRVGCPVLCVFGTDDAFHAPSAMGRVARKYNAELREYPGMGHSLLEEPGWDGIASDMLVWLEERNLSSEEAAGTPRRQS